MELKRSFTHNPTDDSIILVCVIRDERLLLEYFIQHYVKLGVTHFVFVDNDSEDNTIPYLLNKTDIECQVYHTADSYAENEYGITWVNEILDTQCKNKWCVVVDVDELIMPRNNESLSDIKIKMEQNDQNVLPTCLIDFYPKHLDATPYKSGNPFYSHSNHYDKFVEDDYMIYPGEGGELVVKGGMRHRVFGANREPVCLTKKSFFKYDFFETHKLAVGMHWLLPRDFDHTANLPWSAYTNWPNKNKHIKLHPSICVLGHFKFIKPNIYEFFNERVKRNQDWGDSDEYKNYIKTNPTSFFKADVSVAYKSLDKIYEDVIDNIEATKIVVVLYQHHMGMPEFKKRLESVTRTLVCDLAEIKNLNHLSGNKYVVVFMMMSDATDLDKNLKLIGPSSVICLKRHLPHSYAELYNNELTFEKYQDAANKVFSDVEKIVREIGLDFREVWYRDVRDSTFYIKSILT
jgi:hypothetical protein